MASTFSTHPARPDAKKERPHRRSETYGIFASTIICWAILFGAFIVDQKLPPQQAGTVVAIFAPDASPAEIATAISDARGAVVMQTRYAKARVAKSADTGFVGRLTDAGAIAVFAPVGPIGSILLGSRLSSLK
jgi:hypothetical protein